jgi:hypothetical protein
VLRLDAEKQLSVEQNVGFEVKTSQNENEIGKRRNLFRTLADPREYALSFVVALIEKVHKNVN